ncbi:MAG: hypothetical protein IJP23_01070 [Oscillospiraceae bacterium]|nr:hypothetical protein [Oscillospiraceae bacterium]
MNEKKKNRGWVKNVAIIFLVVLLFLTFFSNTIMNRSLPEVSVKYAESGSITTQIRGTGTIEAVDTYQVTIKESRKIKSVAVSPGQQVAAGDLLFVLSEGDSDELAAAKEALETLELSYQKALITNEAEYDYTRQERAITKLEKQINETDALRRDYLVSAEVYKKATDAVKTAEDAVNVAQVKYDQAAKDLKAAESDFEVVSPGNTDGGAVTAAMNALEAARKALSDAENTLETNTLLYGAHYTIVENAAKSEIMASDEYLTLTTDSEREAFINQKLGVYMDYVVTRDHKGTDIETSYNTLTANKKAVADAKAAVNSAKAALDNAVVNQQAGNQNQLNYLYYLQNLEGAKATEEVMAKLLSDAKKTLENAKGEVSALDEKKDSYKKYTDTIEGLQENLEDAKFELEQQKKEDEKAQKLTALDMQALRNDIAKARENVEKISTGTAGGEIYSEVNGIVKSVNITSGGMTEYNQTLAAIEVVDRGYCATMSVTAEQAKKVTVGDFANVSTGWWGGSDITARLTSVRNDPANPREKRLLVFDISGGGVESGTQISLSIGERSRSYDVIVPNSALRSDANGDFVYIVTAKPSPLGNRYSATRIDVQVLAKDDVNAAVSGGISAYDYVITTSTKPIENNMLIRMAES